MPSYLLIELDTTVHRIVGIAGLITYLALSSAMYSKPRLDRLLIPIPTILPADKTHRNPNPKVATPLVLVPNHRSFKHAKPLVHRASAVHRPS